MWLTFCDCFADCPTFRFVSKLHLGLLGVLLLTVQLGCGGSPTAPDRDEVFYLHARGVIDKRFSWERYYPPLDRDATERLPKRVGVAVFDGDVRFSRPMDWYLRTADNTPEKRQISYQSPRQFIFTIYERTDPTEETWAETLARYEETVKQKGSAIKAGRLPIATANAQGRSYLVDTVIESKPENYSATAHEILVRSNNRILLVQIIHDEDIEASVDEMVDAVRSMLVY